jgi:hypothetical protein
LWSCKNYCERHQETFIKPSPVKAAVVQAGSFLFDTPRTLNKLTELTRAAAGRGAQIVVFPEAFVGGYPKGLDFGARIGTRSPEGREDFRRYYDNAIEVVGVGTIRIAELDRRLIARAKFDLDVAGHYARPDVFHLTVNSAELTSVEFQPILNGNPLNEAAP